MHTSLLGPLLSPLHKHMQKDTFFPAGHEINLFFIDKDVLSFSANLTCCCWLGTSGLHHSTSGAKAAAICYTTKNNAHYTSTAFHSGYNLDS